MRIQIETVRRLTVAAGVIVMASFLIAGSAQGAKPRVPGPAGKVLVKPAKYTTLWTVGLYDETVYRAKKLRWRGWGTRLATGRGRLTHCVAEYERCHSFRGVVQFRKQRRFKRCGGPSYPFYTELRLTSGHGFRTRWMRFLDCGRVPKASGSGTAKSRLVPAGSRTSGASISRGGAGG